MQRSEFLRISGLALTGMVLPWRSINFRKSTTMRPNDIQDVIIIGGSYSGLAAAMALGRSLRNVLIIDSGLPCNRQTPYSHNFLTQDGTAPKTIADLARKQVLQYPTIQFYEGVVVDATRTSLGYEVVTGEGKKFMSRKLLFATGIKDILPDIPGLAECWGISVLHCPFCHGYEVRQQPTGLLANGEAGFEMAGLLSNWTKELTVYTNGKADFTEEQFSKMASHSIRIEEREMGQLSHTSGQLNRIVFKDGHSTTLSALYVRTAFVQHCSLPEKLGCELTAEGYVQINTMQQTTIPDIYASGDNTTRMRTVANAVAAGTMAGISIVKALAAATF